MKKILSAFVYISATLFILQTVIKLTTYNVHFVHACRTDDSITNCGTYKATIVFDPMDGRYITSMYDLTTGTTITFNPISHEDSYEQGCWLGTKRGKNNLEYNLCKSSSGEWIVLEGPTKSYER